MLARRALRAGLIAVVVAAVLIAGGQGLYHLSRARCFAVGIQANCRVETERAVVALTFDDGPSLRGVETVLPVLADRGVRATFFLVGREVEAHPGLVARIIAHRHEIANHSYSHPHMVGGSIRAYEREIARTQALLHAAGGRSDLFRPPFGKKLFGLPLALRRQGLRMVMWDVADPPTDDPAEYARRIVAAARPGSIILIHAMNKSDDAARAALPAVLDGLEAKGLEIVPAGELLGEPETKSPRLGAGG